MTNEQLKAALGQCETIGDIREICSEADKKNIDLCLRLVREFKDLCPDAGTGHIAVFAVVMGYMGSKKFYGDGRLYSEADIESEAKSHINRLIPEEGE